VAPRVRRRRWPRRTFISLLVLIVLVVGGWFLVARPILHSYAQGQLDQVLSSATSQVVPVPPPINSLTGTETQIDNLIVLNSSPSDPVTNAVVHIAPAVFASDGSYTGGVLLTFNLYGFPCSVSAIPQASNGGIIVTHVQVSGILSWIMSADELTADLNSHLHDVGSRLQRTITGVTLRDREIDIALGGIAV
jgi:hypothetical protein